MRLRSLLSLLFLLLLLFLFVEMVVVNMAARSDLFFENISNTTELDGKALYCPQIEFLNIINIPHRVDTSQ